MTKKKMKNNKNNNSKRNLYRAIIVILILLSMYGLYFTYELRVAQGYFTADPLVMTINAASGWAFFALLTGFVIDTLLARANGKK